MFLAEVGGLVGVAIVIPGPANKQLRFMGCKSQNICEQSLFRNILLGLFLKCHHLVCLYVSDIPLSVPFEPMLLSKYAEWRYVCRVCHLVLL